MRSIISWIEGTGAKRSLEMMGIGKHFWLRSAKSVNAPVDGCAQEYNLASNAEVFSTADSGGGEYQSNREKNYVASKIQ